MVAKFEIVLMIFQ